MSITDPITGVDCNQSVAGMVAEYERKQAAEEAKHYDPDMMGAEVPKEAMEPNREALDYVRKGRLDPNTGIEIAPTSKTRSAQVKQFGRVSEAYLHGYDMIRWDG